MSPGKLLEVYEFLPCASYGSATNSVKAEAPGPRYRPVYLRFWYIKHE